MGISFLHPDLGHTLSPHSHLAVSPSIFIFILFGFQFGAVLHGLQATFLNSSDSHSGSAREPLFSHFTDGEKLRPGEVNEAFPLASR